MQKQSINTDSLSPNNSETLDMFEQVSLEELMQSPLAHLAKISALQENGKEWTESEAVLSPKQSGSLMSADQSFLYGKMLRELSAQTLAQIFGQLSKPLPTLGHIDLNGNCLIQHGFYPKIESGFTLSDCLEQEVDERYFLSEKMTEFITCPERQRKKIHANNRVALTQQARQYSSWNGDFVKVKSSTKKGYEIAESGDSINFSVPTSKTRRGRVGKAKAQTLDTACNQGVLVQKPETKGNSQGNRIYETTGSSQTLSSNSGGYGAKTGLYEVGTRIRRLTPTECERLQGFEDLWTEKGNYDGEVKQVSDTQRYKCLGNAVTVDVVQSVGERILQAL